MRNAVHLVGLAALALLLAVSEVAAAPPPIVPNEGPPGVPEVQPHLGAGSPSYQPYLYSPGPTAQSGAPSTYAYHGPITGYGPGGMGYPPGAPPNPPYFYGGARR